MFSKTSLIWGVTYFAVFLGVMAYMTKGTIDASLIATVPVMLSSEAIVFSMLYATFYHDGHESSASHSSIK
jgi:hypothetical protein